MEVHILKDVSFFIAVPMQSFIVRHYNIKKHESKCFDGDSTDCWNVV